MDKPTRSQRPVLLMVIGGALIVFAVVILLFNPPSQTAVLPQTNLANSSASSLATESAYPEIPRVDLTDAKKAFDAKTAVFVDARSVEAYGMGHIPGALSIPIDQLSSRLGELKKTEWIITYCT